jgi:hypothetical protein
MTTLRLDDDLSAVDRDALTRSMEICMRDRERREQLLSMLEERRWFEVASFASYVAQGDTMHLDLHEDPPCCGEGERCQPEAVRWAKRLIAAGLSIYEPSPLEALQAAKRK